MPAAAEQREDFEDRRRPQVVREGSGTGQLRRIMVLHVGLLPFTFIA
jgi:hypothetical protein